MNQINWRRSWGFPNNIFPRILQTAYGQLKEIQIYGNDWPSVDGTVIRDYIHVMDLAEAHTAVLEYLWKSIQY